MQLRKKGQGMIEFAIVFLMMLPLLLSVYLVFMLCYDYMTMASLARENARSLSVKTQSDMADTWTSLNAKTSTNNALLGSLYTLNSDSSTYKPVPSDSDPYVQVTMTATRASDGIATYLSLLPDTITTQSTMYWEGYSSST